jgi:DNA uptake protein ComE-like DNA-binding protein
MIRSKASILVGLLWCLALLSVIVIGVLHTARLDLMVVKNYGDRIQAHYLALAGIEKAKALLFQNAKDRSRSGKNHTGELYNDQQQFRDVPFGRGHFRVFRRGRQDEGGGIIYGVSDEESRLNINQATVDQFTNVVGMTPDVAAAIVDWRNDDNSPVTPGGAKSDYYLSLQPPYLPRNAPFQTVRELLMVRGVTQEQLCGQDADQNGLLSSEGGSGDGMPSDNEGSSLEDAGWSAMMTVDSSVNDLSAGGRDRVNIQSADEAALTGVRGITSGIAKAIIAYRGQNQFKSVADLLDVVAQNRNQGGSSGNQGGQTNTAGSTASGPKVVSEDLLRDVADELTAGSDQKLAGAINVNTAGIDVLICLPGIDRELAQAIISYRQSEGFLPNVAWLLKVPGLTRDIFKQIAPLVSVRSETFRIVSEGRVSSTGARQRIQVIVHVGLNDIDTLSYREDL